MGIRSNDDRTATLDYLERARAMAAKLAPAHSDDAPWQDLDYLLEKYIQMARDHWPLTPKEKAECKLGWFAVKNIEEPFPELADLLCRASDGLAREFQPST